MIFWENKYFTQQKKGVFKASKATYSLRQLH